jgi:hypothetical protein
MLMFVNTHYRASCLLSRQIGLVVKSWAGCLLHASNVSNFRYPEPLFAMLLNNAVCSQ